MAVGNAPAGGGAEVRTDGWKLLGEDPDVTIVVARVTEHIAAKHWDKQATMEPAPGVCADFAFVSGPRKGEVIGGETVINSGIVRPLLATKVGNVVVSRVGVYSSRGRSHPCFNQASQFEMTAALAALDEAGRAGHTFTDADGDTVGDIWMHYEKLGGGQSADDDDEPPF